MRLAARDALHPDLHRLLRYHLNGPVHPSVAVVQVHAVRRRLDVLVVLRQYGAQPGWEKNRVWVCLDGPIVELVAPVGDDRRPHCDEDFGVQRRAEFAALLAVQVTGHGFRDEAGHHCQGLIAEHGVLVASEKALGVLELPRQQHWFHAARDHQGPAIERVLSGLWDCQGDSCPHVRRLPRRVFGIRDLCQRLEGLVALQGTLLRVLLVGPRVAARVRGALGAAILRGEDAVQRNVEVIPRVVRVLLHPAAWYRRWRGPLLLLSGTTFARTPTWRRRLHRAWGRRLHSTWGRRQVGGGLAVLRRSRRVARGTRPRARRRRGDRSFSQRGRPRVAARRCGDAGGVRHASRGVGPRRRRVWKNELLLEGRHGGRVELVLALCAPDVAHVSRPRRAARGGHRRGHGAGEQCRGQRAGHGDRRARQRPALLPPGPPELRSVLPREERRDLRALHKGVDAAAGTAAAAAVLLRAGAIQLRPPGHPPPESARWACLGLRQGARVARARRRVPPRGSAPPPL
mmetsp:Transcript_101902/g.288530  ORF Transcript_101902/g.288530 Transcript_101902/m.288530 type:complete len:515 (-) Transcript_101902:22-1566(-)